ncbi:MAG TPA: alpha/beta hydrolase [Planctomycetota bacterium]|nr:alpha/beta hydrolase [Planctomycetota bacterium]
MRLKSLALFLVLAIHSLHSLLFAVESTPLKKPSLPAGVVAEWDVPYIPNGDNSQKLDIFMPEKPGDKPLPLLVWIHGGGWQGGSKNGPPALSYTTDGYVTASVEYRFSQKAVFPAQIQDCQAALRFLRANAAKYHIDPDHVGVWGASAGGHLVALLGTSGGKNAFPKIGGNDDQSDRVQAVCDWFGPADFTTVMSQAAEDKNAKNIFKFNSPSDPYSLLIGVPLNSDKAKTEAVSPVHFVSKDNPPFLIVHGTHDTLVPFAQSEELLAALKKEGVEALLQPMPNSGHGGGAFSKPAVSRLIKNFFDKNLKGKDAKIEQLPDAEVAVPPPPPPASKETPPTPKEK